MRIFTCLDARLAWSYDKASRDTGRNNWDFRSVLPSRRLSLHGLGLTGVSCLVKEWRVINAFDVFFSHLGCAIYSEATCLERQEKAGAECIIFGMRIAYHRRSKVIKKKARLHTATADDVRQQINQMHLN